jgi:AraC-like DNA-binding protein
VSVRSVGHYSVKNGWQDKLGIRKSFVQLFWGIEGEGEFVIDGKTYLFGSGFVTCYFPLEEHIITAVSDRWIYRWVTFDGPLAVELIKCFKYPRDPFFAGHCPEDLFIKLDEGIREIDMNTQRLLGSTLYSILALAGGQQSEGSLNSTTAKRFIKFIRDNYGNETVNVNTASDILGLHRSTLNRAFTAEMHMTPGDYIVNMRIQKALSMLRETELPISEIGAAVGIPDKCYFSKVIRKAAGLGPMAFRKQF